VLEGRLGERTIRPIEKRSQREIGGPDRSPSSCSSLNQGGIELARSYDSEEGPIVVLVACVES
jgi:hypothetical protein